MTRKTTRRFVPPLAPGTIASSKSWNAAMLGWRSAASIRASRRKRERICGSRVRASSSTLTATCAPMRVSSAL
jgi:hypothetical protein